MLNFKLYIPLLAVVGDKREPFYLWNIDILHLFYLVVGYLNLKAWFLSMDFRFKQEFDFFGYLPPIIMIIIQMCFEIPFRLRFAF